MGIAMVLTALAGWLLLRRTEARRKAT
jgi:hypothetical protein